MNSPDFTGERYVPGQGGAQISYEHLHRYHFASRWAAGKDVLDAATGTGYGAAMLGKTARRVWGVDIDAASVKHARRSCMAPNLEFLLADATCLPVRTRAVDVVVAFEVLEHVERQEALVAELARVVRPDGVVLISTPNKRSYSEARRYHNPFHVRELYREELLSLLGAHFSSIRLLQQQVRAGSLIDADEPGRVAGDIIATPAGETPALEPMYFLAVCSHATPIGAGEAVCAYFDTGDLLFGEWSRELARINAEVEKLGLWSLELQDLLSLRDQTIVSLQAAMQREIVARDEVVRGLQAELEGRTRWAEMQVDEIRERDSALQRQQGEFDERTRWAMALAGDVAARDERLKRTNEELDRVAAHLARIRHARLYRILCRLGILPK